MKNAWALLCLAASWAIVEGEPASVRAQVFRARTEVVPIYASVLDHDRRPVTGLRKEDFVVLDDGRPVETILFSDRPPSIALDVVIDISGSMVATFQRMFRGVTSVMEHLASEDRASFRSLHQELVPLTSDRRELIAAVDRLRAQTIPMFATHDNPIWSALDAAIVSLANEDGRRVVLIVTDGGQGERDGASVAFNRMERSDVTVYAVGFEDVNLDRDFRAAIADSGGITALVPKDAVVEKVFEDLLKEMHQAYLLGIVPQKRDGKSHRLSVKVKRDGVEVRARRSYFSPLDRTETEAR